MLRFPLCIGDYINIYVRILFFFCHSLHFILYILFIDADPKVSFSWIHLKLYVKRCTLIFVLDIRDWIYRNSFSHSKSTKISLLCPTRVFNDLNVYYSHLKNTSGWRLYSKQRSNFIRSIYYYFIVVPCVE